MKKNIIILLILSLLISCNKQRECNEIRQEWIDTYTIQKEKLDDLNSLMTEYGNIYGYDSQEYKNIVNQYINVTNEIDSTNQMYKEELSDNGCPEYDNPN